MMENRAYEDEPSKSAQHRYSQQQQQLQQQLSLNLSQFGEMQQQQGAHQHHQLLLAAAGQHESCEPSHQCRQAAHCCRHEAAQHGSSDCHVYEDIVAPYGLALEPGGGGFHRNLTLPLRRASQSCESVEATSSSVRVTSRERTRGSVIDRLARDDRNRASSREESLASGGSSSVERPTRRRRKKDCKHCKVKTGEQHNPQHHHQLQQHQQQQQRDEQFAAYEDRSAELRAIFGLPGLCPLAPGCLGPGVVYAIGCNGADCNGSLVSSVGGGTNTDSTTSTATTTTAVLPRFHEPALDDKALIAAPKQPGPGARHAGMKVNSIYAQEHWHAAKDPRIFLNDPKDQHCNSPFQRAYTAVSSNSPSSDNRANLRRSVRDEPAPHPARLRKHRHGWTLQFGRPLAGANCTKSLVLLLILVLALLGIGGFALYIVFEPEKLHVIQQYLRSSARNSSDQQLPHQYQPPRQQLQQPHGFEEPGSSPGLLDTLLNSSSSGNSLNSNNLQPDGNDVDEVEPVFVTAWTSQPSTSTRRPSTTTPRPTSTTSTTTTQRTTSTTTTTPTTPRAAVTTPSSSSSTLLSFLETHSRRRRPCAECLRDEVCVARNADEAPYCRQPGPQHTTSDGCGGLCDSKSHKCHKLDTPGAYRCVEIEHHCLDDEWTCHNIFCIPLVKRCDGQMNCYDHSDEYNCECDLKTHFHCGNQTSCLPLSKKCDGHVDCFDATDEVNCTTSHELVCPAEDEYTCRNKQQCIKRSRFCDGYRDCKDGSDEPQGCQGRCNKHEFTCHNGRCINKADKCNGIDDCGDGSDEQHCRERL